MTQLSFIPQYHVNVSQGPDAGSWAPTLWCPHDASLEEALKITSEGQRIHYASKDPVGDAERVHAMKTLMGKTDLSDNSTQTKL